MRAPSLPGLMRPLLGLLALLLAASSAGSPGALPETFGRYSPDRGGGLCRLLPEPLSAAAYIEAHRDRDTARAAEITSRLYRVEMERRGRGQDWPLDLLWTGVTPILDFGFVGAIEDDGGYTHALYTAHPKDPNLDGSPTTVWRIDLDPEGRVIWGELTKLIYRSDARVVCTSQVFGVSAPGGDGYVALLATRGDRARNQIGAIAFAIVDEAGRLRDSYWSFGLPVPTSDDASNQVASGFLDRGRMDIATLKALDAYSDGLVPSPVDRPLGKEVGVERICAVTRDQTSPEREPRRWLRRVRCQSKGLLVSHLAAMDPSVEGGCWPGRDSPLPESS